MLFNSYIFFLILLPISLLGYFICNRTPKYLSGKVWLIICSLFFGAWMNPFYAVMICLSSALNYGVYKWISKAGYRSICIVGIVLNLTILGYFKYSNFFLENLNHLFRTEFALIDTILPLGISFYTFTQIAFIVDCYKDRSIEYSFVDYLLYVCYFPKLCQGPMAYHYEIISQFNDKTRKKWDYSNASKGLYLLGVGLVKKVLLADTLAGLVNIGYQQINELNSLEAIIVTFSYTFQIYFDFSGYCDMAAGVSKMFNIDLPGNFDLPYKAISIKEFWRRWHITLTRFFTKYIYIPLGGSKKGVFLACINTLIVFLLSGLWHGAEWNFVLWGALHGTLMILERLFSGVLNKVSKVFRWIMTISCVNIAWIFFRSTTIEQGFLMLRKLFQGGMGSISYEIINYINSLVEVRVLCNLGMERVVESVPIIPLIILFIIIVCIIFKERNYQVNMEQLKLTKAKSCLAMLFLVWGVLSIAGYSEFIYFSF